MKGSSFYFKLIAFFIVLGIIAAVATHIFAHFTVVPQMNVNVDTLHGVGK